MGNGRRLRGRPSFSINQTRGINIRVLWFYVTMAKKKGNFAKRASRAISKKALLKGFDPRHPTKAFVDAAKEYFQAELSKRFQAMPQGSEPATAPPPALPFLTQPDVEFDPEHPAQSHAAFTAMLERIPEKDLSPNTD